jgi:hypothetical protein
MARLTAVVSLLVLSAPLAHGANAGGPSNLPQGEGFLYTRPVTVTAPGWVRVPLDLNTLRHLSPGSSPGADLRVFSPEGVEVASRVATYQPGVEGRVESIPDPSLAITSREADCTHPNAARTVCRLVLPASGQVLRRLLLEVEGSGEVGYRLYAPHDFRWRQLAQGIWPLREESGGEREIPMSADPVPGDALWLELYGSPQPDLKGWSAELAVATALFHAEAPGIYTLAYGGSSAGRKELPRSARATAEEAAWLSPGPEEEHAPPPLPAPAVEPGAPLGETRFATSWKIAAPEARPGSLVRLSVPAAAYGPARPDLADLRLAASGRQIPYLRWTSPVPVLVRETSAQPVRSWERRTQGGASRIDLDLPQTGLPLTQMLLTGPPMPLRRGLSLLYMEPARPGAGASERTVARGVWQCTSRAPLPCRDLLALDGRAPRLLSLRFEDGDNPPLGSLDLSLWRREDVLLFVWPERGDVRLLAGAAGLTAPDYDLAALGDQLLARPWRPAELDRGGSAAPAPRWARWILPVTLGVASLLLLALLRRVLRL